MYSFFTVYRYIMNVQLLIYITSLMAFLNTDAVSPFDKTADS